MFSVKEVAPPKKRAVFRGYRAEISVSKMFEPRKKTLVVLLPDPSLLVSVIPQVRLREELHDDLWRAMDDKEVNSLTDRIVAIEEAWGDKGIRVRRKILWF